jgi:hypothetical protein
MSDCCCSPLGPGGGASAFRIQDDGTPLPQEAALNVIGGTLADNPGNGSTDLTLFYQTVEWGSEAVAQEPALNFAFNDFTIVDEPGSDTRVSIKNPLPAVVVGDAQDVLAVNAAGSWAEAANGFLSFATTAARDAYVGLRTAGQLAYVATTQCLYLLAPNLTTWLFYAPSPALAAQAAWSIDAGAGSDNNSGAPGSPLASTEEISRRLSPGGAVCYIQQNTAIAIAAGTYGDLFLVYTSAGNTAFSLTINAAFTAVADTLTSVVNTVAGATQGRITVAAGPLTARMRIRSTSGAQINAITYGTGPLNSSTDTFVKGWYPSADTLNYVNVANGTTVALETLTVTINRFYIRPVLHNASGTPTLRVNDVDLPDGFIIPDQGGSSVYVLHGCKIGGGRSNGNVRLVNCQFTGSPQFSSLAAPSAGAPTLAGCVCNGNMIISGVNVVLNACNCMDAAQWQIGAMAVGVPTAYGSALSSFGGGGGTEWSNGAGLTAVLASQGAFVGFMSGGFFGFGTAYAVGYNLDTYVTATCVTIASVSIPSTQNVIMAGNNRTYAQLPGDYQRAACVFATSPDTTALFNSL